MSLLVRERAATAEVKGVERLIAKFDQSLPAPPVSPFPIVIGPEQAVRHRSWREARDRVLAALRTGSGPVLVTAVPGAGKTLFLRALARELQGYGADVLLLLRGDVPLAENAVEMGRRRVALIDDAERIDWAALDRLRQFGECATVLAMTSPPGAAFSEAGTVVRLAALAPDEVGAFTATRLHEAGLDADLITDAAVARLAELSGGLPGALNRLAGAALFLARVEESPRVEADHVDQAAMLEDVSADRDMLAADAPQPASAEPEQVNPMLDGASNGAHAAALPVITENARTNRVNPFVAAFAAVSLLILCGSLLLRPVLLRPGAMEDRSRFVTASRVSSPGVEPGAAPPRAPRDAGAAAVPAPPISAAPRIEPAAPTPAPPALEHLARADAQAPAIPAAPDIVTSTPSETPLPVSAPVLVAVRYDRGVVDAPSRAATYAAALRAAGFAVDGPAPVAGGGVKPGAHYRFSEDRDAATAVLKALGLPGREIMADPPERSLPPRPGLIEFVTSSDEAEARVGPRSPGGGHS